MYLVNPWPILVKTYDGITSFQVGTILSSSTHGVYEFIS